jgi:pimeloyl-ACP methyl ester carboxylesterase
MSSISSSAGPRAAPFPRWRVVRRMLSAPDSRSTHAQRVDHYVALFTEIGRHHDPLEIERLRMGLDRALQRAYRPEGTLRQLLAIVADPDRSTRLRALTTPTLIVHGALDPLVPPAAAQHLAGLIAGARLQLIDGLGHDLPAWWMPQLVDLLAGQVSANEPSGAFSGVSQGE